MTCLGTKNAHPPLKQTLKKGFKGFQKTETLSRNNLLVPMLNNNVGMSQIFRLMFLSGIQVHTGHICHCILWLKSEHILAKSFSFNFVVAVFTPMISPDIITAKSRNLLLLSL